MSKSSESSSDARCAMCGTRLRSAGPFSRATRIRLYMIPLPHQIDEPDSDAEVVRQIFDVQTHNQRRGRPREYLDPGRVDEVAHLRATAREDDERHDRE